MFSHSFCAGEDTFECVAYLMMWLLPWRESADRVDLEEMVDCVETVDMQSVAVLSDPIDLLLSVPLLTSF